MEHRELHAIERVHACGQAVATRAMMLVFAQSLAPGCLLHNLKFGNSLSERKDNGVVSVWQLPSEINDLLGVQGCNASLSLRPRNTVMMLGSGWLPSAQIWSLSKLLQGFYATCVA